MIVPKENGSKPSTVNINHVSLIRRIKGTLNQLLSCMTTTEVHWFMFAIVPKVSNSQGRLT